MLLAAYWVEIRVASEYLNFTLPMSIAGGAIVASAIAAIMYVPPLLLHVFGTSALESINYTLATCTLLHASVLCCARQRPVV
jgi:hypothetical protein